MTDLIKLVILTLLLMPSCSTTKITQNDISDLQNHWIHSHEEDMSNVKVFRPSDHSFGPSRGREEIILKTGGELSYRPISPNDQPVFISGEWKVEGAKLMLNFDGKKKVYKIIELKNNILKMK